MKKNPGRKMRRDVHFNTLRMHSKDKQKQNDIRTKHKYDEE